MIAALALTALLFSMLATVGAIYACIQVEAFKRSTHQVTFLDPMKQTFENLSDEAKVAIRRSMEPAQDIM